MAASGSAFGRAQQDAETGWKAVGRAHLPIPNCMGTASSHSRKSATSVPWKSPEREQVLSKSPSLPVKTSRLAMPSSSLHDLHQFGVAINDVVLHAIRCDLGEEFPGAFNLTTFDRAKLQTGKAAFGLGNEVDVLHLPHLKRDRPVRMVVAQRSGYEETSR